LVLHKNAKTIKKQQWFLNGKEKGEKTVILKNLTVLM
jgi:hypothetical protein